MVWALVVPPLQCPDELAHFIYVHFLAEEGRLPGPGAPLQLPPELQDFKERVSFEKVAFHPEVRYRSAPPPRVLNRGPETGGSSVAGYPPAYYAAAALGYRALNDDSIDARFRAARFVSVLLGLASVAAAWGLGRLLLPNSSSFPAAMALFVGLQPMASMLSAAVNSDALLIPASAVVVFLALRCEPSRARPLEALFIGLTLGLTVLAKPQGAFVAAWAMSLLLYRACRGAAPFARSARTLSVAGGTAAIVASWWWILAWVRFGSPFGAIGAPPDPSPLSGSSLSFLELNCLSKAALSRAFHLWVKTYWADFGWLDTHFSSLVPYVAIAASIALAALGIARAYIRQERPGRREIGTLAIFVVANVALLYTLEAVYVSRYRLPMLQGRYLLTALLPGSALLLVGWRSLAPERARPLVDGAAILGIVVLHLASLLLILGRYHGVGPAL